MPVEHINPSGLSQEMLDYAFGNTDKFPNVLGLPRKQIAAMLRMRRSFIRNLLLQNAARAYALPDFMELMHEEIWRYAKNTLRPRVFLNWEQVIRKAPRFQSIFNRESAQLYRDYQDAIWANRPFIKHRYLSITSKRRSFASAIRNPNILAEIELACDGKTTYGLP